MSSIESNNQSLNNILEKIGVKSPEAPSTKEKQSRTGRFSKTHDYSASKSGPFCPYGKWGFIAQMAQFSTVTGLQKWGKPSKVYQIN